VTLPDVFRAAAVQTANNPPADPAAVQAVGRAVVLLGGLAAFALVLTFGLLFVVARRRNRRRALERAAHRPADPRDPWAESARRMPTPPDDTPPEADPNEDTTPWDAPLPPHTDAGGNGATPPDARHDDPDNPDDPEGPYQ